MVSRNSRPAAFVPTLAAADRAGRPAARAARAPASALRPPVAAAPIRPRSKPMMSPAKPAAFASVAYFFSGSPPIVQVSGAYSYRSPTSPMRPRASATLKTAADESR